jgi:hypothetical protein
MSENGNGKLFGWRKMIAGFGSMGIIFAATAIYQWLSEDGLGGDQFVDVVYANMWIVISLMGGNAVSHIAQNIGKK